jgi:hypothetical protein
MPGRQFNSDLSSAETIGIAIGDSVLFYIDLKRFAVLVCHMPADGLWSGKEFQ